jgi:hypothetical protein
MRQPRIFMLVAAVVVALFAHTALYAQVQQQTTNTVADATDPDPVVRCYTHEYLQNLRAINPKLSTDADFEAWIAKTIADRLKNGAPEVAYTVPVIFHIVHNGEAIGATPNIGANYINAQINQLNLDYANLSGSPYSSAANIEIQFCAAIVDPNGVALAEPGIHRVNRTTAGFTAPPYTDTYVDATIKPATIWDANRYFNIWTLNMSGGVLGYATFPTASGLAGLSAGENAATAGVVLGYNTVGSTALPFPTGGVYAMGKTLTHEAGHFFGLRHIWGDGACATDYCNDTPPHQTDNSGCPDKPITCTGNTTTLTKEMVQNYMDYTNDVCLNTFTNDQKSRMQAVMANSPRRVTLATSTVCTPLIPNAISFITNTTTTTENSTATTCPRYTDIPLTIDVATAATGTATVTITATGTATQGTDYAIIPNNTIAYTNADAANKIVTLRIFDDGVVEPNETIILTYTISGSGVVASTTNQTHTVTIADNDYVPTVLGGTITLINQNFGTTGGTLPTGWATINTTGTTNVWTVGANGGMTSQSAYITNNTSTKPLSYTANSAADVILKTGLINATGLQNLNLSFKYKCNGEADAGGIYDYGNLMYSTNGTTFATVPGSPNFQGVTASTTYTLTLPASFNNSSFYLGFRWQNDNSVRNNPAFVIDDVLLTGTAPNIESTLTHSVAEPLGPNQTAYFFSANDGELLAKIENLSAHDYGCTTIEIDRSNASAAAGAVPFWYNNAGDLLTAKSFKITPTTNNPTGAYNITLYYKTTEVNAWQTATGKTWANAVIYKNGGSITNITPATPFANGQTIYQNATAKGTISTEYYITGNFATGFSGFAVGTPTTPPLLNLQPKAILQGCYTAATGLMTDNLRTGNHLPTTEPYTALGYPTTEAGAATTTAAATFATTGNTAVVDWVYIVLRNATTPTTIVKARTGLLLRNGNIVAPDGTSNLTFNVPAADYKVEIRHRNHLSIMTAANAPFTGSSTPIVVDFTNSNNAAYGANAQSNLGGGKFGLISGDANRDKQVNATDFNALWLPQNGQTYNYTTSNADFNLDAQVNAADFNAQWLPNNSKQCQVP